MLHYLRSSSIWLDSSTSCSRIYRRIVASSRPTVLTHYPRAQKCIPVTRRCPSNRRWISTALLPFKKPITNAMLNLGGTLRHMWTWSAIKWPSSKSTVRCRHRSLMISPTRRRNLPYKRFCQYFGTITTWYLQSHLTCGRLVQSCIGSSSFCRKKGLLRRKSLFFSPRIGRTSPGPPPEVEGLDQN